MEREANAEFKTSWVEYISHEMRTPLGIISMGLELTKSSVLEGTKDPADILSTLSDLEVPCNKAVGLLDQLLYLERLEKNEVHLELKTYSPLQLLREAARGVEKMASEHGVSLKAHLLDQGIHFDPKTFHVNVDIDRLAFVLSKILARTIIMRPSNADIVLEVDITFGSDIHNQRRRRDSVKFIRKSNSINPLFSDDCFVRIKVPLPGVLSKIDEEILKTDRLTFERRPHEDSADFGIGIYIGKRLMELHNGSLNTGVALDGVTPCVLFELPISDGPPSSISAETAHTRYHTHVNEQSTLDVKLDLLDFRKAHPFRPTNNNFKKLSSSFDGLKKDTPPSIENVSRSLCQFPFNGSARALDKRDIFDNDGLSVLVVDDSSLTRKILIKVMLSMGHHCAEAEDGSIAVEMVRKVQEISQPYDVILMDNVINIWTMGCFMICSMLSVVLNCWLEEVHRGKKITSEPSR